MNVQDKKLIFVYVEPDEVSVFLGRDLSFRKWKGLEMFSLANQEQKN